MATVTLSFNFDSAELPRAVHALCKTAGYTETNANAKKAIIDYVKGCVRAVELEEAQVSTLNNQLLVPGITIT